MPRLNRQTVLITAGGVGLLLAARALIRWWREYDLRDKVHSLFPGWTADMLGLANTLLLPAPGGIGTARLPGKHSSSALSPSWLTTLSDRAAQRNNENI